MDAIEAIVSDRDLEAITGVINESFLTVAQEFGFTREKAPTFPAYISQDILRKQRENGLELYKYIKEEKMVGCIGFKDLNQDHRFRIERLAVLPKYRHFGIGSKLMRFALSTIASRNGKYAEVEIVNENTRLKDWYLAQGFKEIRVDKYGHLPFTVSVLVLLLGGRI